MENVALKPDESKIYVFNKFVQPICVFFFMRSPVLPHFDCFLMFAKWFFFIQFFSSSSSSTYFANLYLRHNCCPKSEAVVFDCLLQNIHINGRNTKFTPCFCAWIGSRATLIPVRMSQAKLFISTVAKWINADIFIVMWISVCVNGCKICIFQTDIILYQLG